MSEEVIIVSDEGGSEEVAEGMQEVADAIDASIEVEQSFDIGVLVGEVNALKEKVQYHDDLINLHTHDGLADREMLVDCEERIVGRIDSLQTPEPIMEDVPPAGSEPSEEAQAEEETNNDIPPKSRSKKGFFSGGIASSYYKSSKL